MRIKLGVPEGGRDYAFGDDFPHEALFDQLNGVDFNKGCYVGQEVVSRMEHRGTGAEAHRAGRGRCAAAGVRHAASRPAACRSARSARSSGASGLALIRLDRAEEALAKGNTLTAGGVRITLRRPAFARFAVPVDGARRMSGSQAQALPVAGHRSALCRLSRRGMGRAGARRPGALREARARRLPGGALLDHHPAEARGLPPRVRRFRAGEDRALHEQEGRSLDAGRGHRAQSHEDRRRDRLGARLARDDGARRRLRPLSLGASSTASRSSIATRR